MRRPDDAPSGPVRTLPDFPMPGADLAVLVAALGAVEVADVGDADVVAAIAGWQQVIDAATAAQAAAIGELAARRDFSTINPVDDEVALALAATRTRASHLVCRADFLTRHPAVADAMRDGLLDAGRVDVLDEETCRLPHGEAARVLDQVLDRADGLTTTHLRRLTRRLVAAVDPEAASTRAEKARAERCVRLQPGPDAMAWIHAYLPATDAVTVFAVVDALAGIAARTGDERPVDQRRADALTDVFHAIAATGTLPDGSALPSPQGHQVGVQVAVNATTLLGLDELPGELTGYGPIPAAMARDLAARGSWRAVLTDARGRVLHVADTTHPAGPVAANSRCASSGRSRGPSGAAVGEPPEEHARSAGRHEAHEPRAKHGEGRYHTSAALTRTVTTRDPVCCFAGCAQPAWRCDLDHEIPYDPSNPDTGPTCACNLRPLCRRHHRLKTHAGWTITTDPLTGQIGTRSPSGLVYIRPQPTLVVTSDPFATGPTGGPAADASRGDASERDRPPSPYDGPPPF
jgi:hypothetical protein